MAKNSKEVDEASVGEPTGMASFCEHQNARADAAVECFEKVHESDGSLVVLFREGRGMVEVDAELPETATGLGSGTPDTGDPVPVETVDVVLDALAHEFEMSRQDILSELD